MARRIQKNRRRANNIGPRLSKDTKRGILAIFLFALSAVLFLAIIGLAGRGGIFINNVLIEFFGQSHIIFPIILAALAAVFLIPANYETKTASILGLIIFLVATSGLLETLKTFAPDTPLAGGYFGYLISSGLLRGFGRWATLIIFVAAILVSILIIGNTSLERVAASGKLIGRIIKIVLWPFLVIKYFLKKSSSPQILEGGEPIKQNSGEPSFVMREIPLFKKQNQENKTQATKPAANSEFTEGLRPRGRKRIDIPFDLLNNKTSKPTAGDIKKNLEIISQTLANFGIKVEMGNISVGPTVTQYTLKPQDGVKLIKITGLANDLALALAAHPIRIEAPIPGKSLVGIEVPNQTVATVNLREVLESQAFRDRRNSLMMALGKDVAGMPWFADLPKQPHLLVAGSTGSGKTVCLNSIIISLLYQNSPDDLKLILIDPKRVELPVYNGIPHLLIPVITDVPKTINALKWTITEMERRFETLEKVGARDITNYNSKAEEKMPTIVIVVDELADLMATAAAEIEASVIRVAQMARAVGIHLILATQRPSVDVITGLIKANIPTRIAFVVASQIDSRTILDTAGAEKLLGRGDMLFTAPELSKPRRIQGAYISDEEISRVVKYLKQEHEAPNYDITITEKQRTSTMFSSDTSSDGDPLIPEAKDVILQAGKASASLLQRRLKVGYARAARLLDLLEAEGFVGPGDGAKPREVLFGGVRSVPTQFEPKYQNLPQTNADKEDDNEQFPPWE